MRHARFFISILGAALLVLGFEACTPPVSPTGTTGSLSIALSNAINAKTLAPSISMDAATYTITGTGPNSAAFPAATSTGAAVTENGLAFGSWTIVVNALNASGTLIGTGTATAQVNTGQTTAISVTVKPISGMGTLSLSVNWPASQVQTPSIAASLTPALGSAQSLAFTVSGSTATYTNSAVGNGYYTLAFTIDDNGIAEAGAVEVVRIVAGQATSGSYTFANVNPAGGNIQVNIAANMENPLNVAIAGASATLTQGSTQALTANISNYAGDVVYVWYVNGVSVGTGTSYAFGSNQAPGYYRIDVTAFSADGQRAGSANASVQVAAPVVGSRWVQKTASAQFSAREHHSSLVFDNKMWVIGGYVWNQIPTSDVYSSADGVNWVLVSTGNFPRRAEHASVVFNNRMWIIGGADRNGSGNYVNLSDVLSSADGVTWTVETTTPAFGTRLWHSCLVYDNKIWLIAGYSGDCMNDVWYSTDGRNWIRATAHAQFALRQCLTAAVFNNQMEIIAGSTYFGTNHNDVWSSTNGSSWTCLLPDNAAPPASQFAPRRDLSSVVLGSRLYVLCGSRNDVWSSEDGVAWTCLLADNPSPNQQQFAQRCGQTSLVFLGKIWVIGGMIGDGGPYSTYFSDVWCTE